jgi:hypothetical protein
MRTAVAPDPVEDARERVAALGVAHCRSSLVRSEIFNDPMADGIT